MLGTLLRKWFRKEEGATAIEFSLLAMPYFLLTFGILEISIMFTSATLLESATNSASRLIRTGEVQQFSGNSAQMFRDALCDGTTRLVSCDDVVIEVLELDSFNDFASVAAQFDVDGNLVSSGFDTGGSDDRVLVRVGYRYDMMTPFIGPLLAGADNSILFMSTVVLQSEPYDFGGAV